MHVGEPRSKNRQREAVAGRERKSERMSKKGRKRAAAEAAGEASPCLYYIPYIDQFVTAL